MPRIIYDITAPCQTLVSGRLYSKNINEKYSHGFKTNITMFICPDGLEDKYHGTKKDVLEIEGDAKYIIQAFEEAIEQLKLIGEGYTEEGSILPDWDKVEDWEEEQQRVFRKRRKSFHKKLRKPPKRK